MNKFNYPRNYFSFMRSLREKLPERVIGTLDLDDQNQRIFMASAVCFLAKSGQRSDRNGVVTYKKRTKSFWEPSRELCIMARFTEGVARAAHFLVYEKDRDTNYTTLGFSWLYFCRKTQQASILSGE